jgi:hypothetical protein
MRGMTVQVIAQLADLGRGEAANAQVSGLPRTLNSPWQGGQPTMGHPRAASHRQ